MSMQWIRDHYGVPAKRGGLIRYEGLTLRIKSATHHLHAVVVSPERNAGCNCVLHPTWHVEYLNDSLAADIAADRTEMQ